MSDKKQPIGKILSEDEKKNLDKYPDHMKSPMHGLKDRKEVLKDAEEEE